MKKIVLTNDIIIQLKSLLAKFNCYTNFSRSKKFAYKYIALIGLKVCPYCNINYIYTVFDEKGKELVRGDLDHFISQSSNESQSLNWENLIPSCQQCNSRLKLAKEFDYETHIHPFRDDFDSIKKISVYIRSVNYTDEDNFKIIFIDRDKVKSTDINKANRNISDFKLNERYQHHKDEVVNIFLKLQFYHKRKVEEISNLVNQGFTSEHLLLHDANCEINNTSLGKLKRDIINKYK